MSRLSTNLTQDTGKTLKQPSRCPYCGLRNCPFDHHKNFKKRLKYEYHKEAN